MRRLLVLLVFVVSLSALTGAEPGERFKRREKRPLPKSEEEAAQVFQMDIMELIGQTPSGTILGTSPVEWARKRLREKQIADFKLLHKKGKKPLSISTSHSSSPLTSH